MGNTTNELLGLARSVSPAPQRRELDMLVTVGERNFNGIVVNGLFMTLGIRLFLRAHKVASLRPRIIQTLGSFELPLIEFSRR